MELRDLIQFLVRGQPLAARQWLADAQRLRFDWSTVSALPNADTTSAAVAAGVVEMMAERAGVAPPAWTGTIPGVATPLFLVRAAATMTRLRRLCEEEGPWPLRRRLIFAPPEFLTLA
jgi:hypothetical protein